MMQLSPEKLKFIDTYLQNSGVFYYDIRLELVDHIASGVQDKMITENIDFYDAFKSYMVENKSNLLKFNKQNFFISWHVFKSFLRFITKPYMVLFFILINFVYSIFDIQNYFTKDFTINQFFYLILIILVLLQVIYFHVVLKIRYFVIEKVTPILTVIYYFLLFFIPVFDNKPTSIIYCSMFTYFFVGYIIYLFVNVRSFKKNILNIL